MLVIKVIKFEIMFFCRKIKSKWKILSITFLQIKNVWFSIILRSPVPIFFF